MKKIKNYSIYIIISFILTLIFLCLSAAIFTYTSISDRHLQTFVFGTILLSNLIGSTLFARKNKEKGLVYGAIFGILYCLLLYLVSVVAFTGFFVSNTLFIYLGICIVSGIIGGIIGVNI